VTSRLPVAEPAQVRRAAIALFRADKRAVGAILVINGLAAGAGLVGPWLLGRIVNDVRAGTGVSTVDRLALIIGIFAVAQFFLTRYASYVAHRFGERTAARVREQFVDRSLALPAAVVERAGTGDLTTRGTSDVAAVASALRDAGPVVIIAALQALIIVVAVFVLAPLLGLCGVIGLAGIVAVGRWYLRRARAGYLAEGAANSELSEVLAATAVGARTVEAFGLQQRRITACETAIDECRRTRMRTLFLRGVLYTCVDISYVIPVVGVLLIGGVLHNHGMVSLGAVVAAALYLRQLSQPLDTILLWVDQLQTSSASFARVEGLTQAQVPAPADGGAPPPMPVDDRIELTDVHYAYDTGHDVLHGVTLTVEPGERLALVGPSGAGKTTLGRLIAGIDRPGSGTVTVGRIPVTDLEPDELRRQIILVTQEQHIFLGTIGDNLRIGAPAATDDQLAAALNVVGADWTADLPEGLDTELGVGGHHIDGSQAQQLALARVVLANPHTLILDEATALLDPAMARRTERALAAVLEQRTVVAIAHRLHTAHDADRVAVMENGRLIELGTHDELATGEGPYAALWHSWHGEPATPK
jgi:ATP-binding cassette, subfamily C, bacterial